MPEAVDDLERSIGHACDAASRLAEARVAPLALRSALQDARALLTSVADEGSETARWSAVSVALDALQNFSDWARPV